MNFLKNLEGYEQINRFFSTRFDYPESSLGNNLPAVPSSSLKAISVYAAPANRLKPRIYVKATRKNMETVYDFSVRTIKGEIENMETYSGKVLLIVNTASRCGFTNQYTGLERLQMKYVKRSFCVLGFPCNQFLNQEPSNEDDIAEFCVSTYNVSFPLFSKIHVNGNAAHPLYNFLKCTQPGILGTKSIKWNFTKFLVDRKGHPVARFAPVTDLSLVEAAIKKLL